MEEILATYSYTELGPAYIISCTNTAECTKAIIPATYNNRKVTVLGDNCFKNAPNLHTVEFEAPDNITRFADSCFQNCSSLINITLPKLSYQHGLGGACFSGCTSIKEMVIPETQTRIPQSCFSGCVSLMKIKLSTKVAYVETNAFAGCSSLQTLVISDATTEIGVSALPSGIEMLVLGKKINRILGYNNSPKEIIILADNPPIFSGFYPSNKVEKVYCHSGLAAKYKAAPGWSSLTAEFVDDDVVLYSKLNAYYSKEYFDPRIDEKSAVSVSAAGSSSTEVNYITVNGTESKLPSTEVIDTTGGNIQSAPAIVPSLSIVEDGSTTISISSVKANTMYKCTGDVTSFSAAFDSSFPDGGFAEFIFNGTASMTVDFTVPSGMSVTTLDTTFGADTNYCIMAQRQGGFIWLVEMNRELPATSA